MAITNCKSQINIADVASSGSLPLAGTIEAAPLQQQARGLSLERGAPAEGATLRVNVVNNFLYLRGGAERVCFEEAEKLRAWGHAVSAFGRIDGHGSLFGGDRLYPPVVDFAAKKGLPLIGAALGSIYSPATGRRFRSFLRHSKPDVVHFHNIYSGLTTAVIDACVAENVASVITLHDYKLACPSYLMLRSGEPCRRCERGGYYQCVLGRCHKDSLGASAVVAFETYFNRICRKYEQADAIVTPSRFLLERMAASNVPAGKLIHIPNGVACGDVRPVCGDGGYVLYFGRVSREKGIRTLLAATAGLGAPVRIVGEGPDKAALEAFATERGIGNVTFEGYQSGPELAASLAGAAVVVVPSVCYENASLSILEAMAHGKAIVASRIGGIPEQIVDGETGLLVPPGDARALREALARLLTDSCWRRRLGRAGRARVESEFSLERHCRRLLDLYARVIVRH